MQVTLSRHESPVGPLLSARSSAGLHVLSFSAESEGGFASVRAQLPDATFEEGEDALMADTLAAYFSGDLRVIDQLKVEARGTPFQQRVWAALREIPVGSTLSYGALATQLGKTSAVRAVGMANARNPIALVVPCHRVIAASGALQGYAGGLWRKEWLLAHEKAVLV